MGDPLQSLKQALALVGLLQGPSSGEEQLLSANGWIPLGKEAFTGEPGWTTLERGLRGAVSQREALRILRGVNPLSR